MAFTYVSRAEEAATTAQEAHAAGARAVALHADSADADALTTAVARAVDELGGLNVLVHNSGIAVIAPLEEFRLEDLDRTLAVNVRAAFVVAQAAARHMRVGGRIITIGSCNAERMPFAACAVCSRCRATARRTRSPPWSPTSPAPTPAS